MTRKNIIIFSCLLLINLKDVASQTIENFESTGVYFKHMGELMAENDAFLMSTFIRLEPYHKAIEIVGTASKDYRNQCLTLEDNSNCEQEYEEIQASHTDLVRRLNNIYEILQETPATRRKRSIIFNTFSNLNQTKKSSHRQKRFLGFFLGLFNSGRLSRLQRDMDKMKNYMNENFQDIDDALKKQQKVQVELQKQQNNLFGKLEVHETKLFEISSRIDNLEKASSELATEVDAIRMRVIFHSLKIDALEILGKLRELEQWMLDLSKNILHPEIMSPESITDALQGYKLGSGRFLASPNLNNYPLITETMTGSAFIATQLKTIFINLQFPIYQEEKLNLFQVINVPMMRSNKVLRIANNQDNYCVFSEDKQQYSCSGLNKFVKGKNFYFNGDDGELSLLPTINARGKCIVNIFTETSLDSCRYQEVNQNLEIIEEIDTHKYLFAVRDKTSYFYECTKSGVTTNNYDKDDHLQNTGIIFLKPDCVFEMGSGESYFKTNSEVKTKWDEKDIFKFKYLEDEVDKEFVNYKFAEFVAKEKTKINFDMFDQLSGL